MLYINPFHRITSDCFNNSFFSSALREWVEQIATGSFTAEHRTRIRAEEKKKKVYQKAESTWKAKFFEENWGDRCVAYVSCL